MSSLRSRDSSFRLYVSRLVAGYWSAASAARALDVSASTYASAESGRRKPASALLERASEIFGVSSYYLKDGEVASARDNFTRRIENILVEEHEASRRKTSLPRQLLLPRSLLPIAAQHGEHDFAGRLRVARIESHFSSALAAARHLKIPMSTYTAHESGRLAITTADLVLYAGAFSCSPEYLILGEPFRKEVEWGAELATRHNRSAVVPPLRLVSLRYAEMLDGTVRVVSGTVQLPIEAMLGAYVPIDAADYPSAVIYEQSELLGILHKSRRGNVMSTLIVDPYFPISRRFEQVLVSDGEFVFIAGRDDIIDGEKAHRLLPYSAVSTTGARRRQPFAIGGYVTTMLFDPRFPKKLLRRFPLK